MISWRPCLPCPLRKATFPVVVGLLATVFTSAAARAEVWRFAPILSQAAEWNDNALMLKQDPIELYGSVTKARLVATGETPRWALTFDNTAVQNLFNESGMNSTDFHSRTRLARKTARTTAALGLRADYDTTRTSEVTTFGSNARTMRHLGYALAPEISFTPNATNAFSLSGDYTAARYETKTYTDYDVYDANATWTHAVTPSLNGLFVLHARRYQTRNNTKETVDSVGPSAGASLAINERLKARLTAGLEASKRERENATADEAWTWSNVFAGSLTFMGETNSLELNAKRAQQPYGSGTSSLLTSVGAKGRHALTPLFSLTAEGEYARAQDNALSTSSLKTKWSGGTGLVYHALPDVDVEAAYRHREEAYRDTTLQAKDNALMLTLRYTPEPLAP